MDALFGLPRKKSAGVSNREPLLRNLYFYNQCAVDQFVKESGKAKSQYNVSSKYLPFPSSYIINDKHAMIS